MKCILCYIQKHLQEINDAELENLKDLIISEQIRRKWKSD